MNMDPEMNIEDLARLQTRARAWLDQGWVWPQILEQLEEEGIKNLDLTLLLRSMKAWQSDTRMLKQVGWPYDEIVGYLRIILATWADVAVALQRAGLSPADILRAAMPFQEDESVLWNLLQVTVCSGPEGADYEEARGVLEYFGVDVEQILNSVPMSEELKAIASQRLQGERSSAD